MFKLLDFEEIEKKHHLLKHQNELNQLPSLIDVIRFYEVGINCLKSDRSYDIVIVAEFESLNALSIYSEHPEHKRVVKYIRSIAHPSVVVDYETSLRA